MEIIVDFYKDLQQLGPGSGEQTKKALGFVEFTTVSPKIADIGCGTGAQTLVLAAETAAEIIAVDFLDEFLEKLKQYSEKFRIQTLNANMSDLPFREEEFDLIWSEGAVYNVGFNEGTRYWNQFLKTNGFLVVTEISWLTDTRPAELEAYWQNAYPEIDTIENKICQLEKNGYELVEHFTLPVSCWTENYYRPMQNKFDQFLMKWNYSDEAQRLIDECKAEIKLFEQYHDFYGYEFYIAKKKHGNVSQ